MSEPIQAFIPPTLADDEAHIIRRLGWAVVVQWRTLSAEAQARLREQAVFTEDKYPTVQLNEQIGAFIKMHMRDNDA